MVCLHCRHFQGGKCPTLDQIFGILEYDYAPCFKQSEDYVFTLYGCKRFASIKKARK